jgi:DNA topoisomerase-1
MYLEDTTTPEVSNYNKKLFWSYKRLDELKNTKKNDNKLTNILNTNKINTIDNIHTIDKTNKKKKTKKVFHVINNKVVTNPNLIKRLDSIYIPPAYKNLIVAKKETNKVQVIGTDDRGRRQYIYHTNYTKKRNSRKYDDVMELGKCIIQIEKDNNTMINELSTKKYKDWQLPNDYIPVIIYMLRTYNFRIGNECYANDNESYGITTLKKNHIHFLEQDNKHNFKIEFVGKKGIINTYTDNSNNHKISDILKVLIANASSDGYLFKYENNDKQYFITPDQIQIFFQDKYNAYITPKMFRTWYGNFHMINYLNKLFKENKLKTSMLKSEIKELISNCSKHVSSKLNNTPSISKKSYIDNKILDLVIKNPYKFASSIPNSIDEQHIFLYKTIMKLRNMQE